MLEEFSISLFVIALLGAVGMVAMVLFRQTLLYATRNAVAELEGKVARTRTALDEAVKAHDQNLARGRDLAEERRMIQNQLAEAQRRLIAAQADNFELIHEVGEPGTGRRLYTGSLALGPTLTINQTATTHSHLRGCPHVVEVWAENQAEAMRLARQAFPELAGFILSSMLPVPDGAAQQAAAS
ncbi:MULTISPECIES: hypothetical protein [Nitrospirillum]|uniref:Bacteriophage Rz lysis protein n=1 Tax=Nitrospirillum amazonense TaxID=28077 RepID=A0A560ETY6_9PROT|nr:hypothetical protein [Nitrospirillum amazonense]MEC4594990.1 hypothetical protein [Nitrospirillum amazonense]TWB12787.1 hypothetical protein FBZ88_14411 [Nitrospirillum amazonense]